MIATAPVEELEGFARDQLDLDRFATFEALDVIFGGDQHDFDQNHKLYCDPYRGRFEPIAWNFRGWKHEPKLHLVQNPITIRLGLLPSYVSLRNRTIHEYLLGPCSVSALQSRLRKTLRKVAPDLTSDPHWDAYKLLPGASPYLRRMVRPMDGRRQALAIASELATFAQRHAFLLERIEGNHLRCTAGSWRDGVQPMLVEADGCAGYRLEGCRVEGRDGTTGPWTLFADTSLDGQLDPEHDELVVQADTGSYGEARLPGLELHPLAQIVRREHPTELAGDVELAPLPGRYVFFLQSDTPPTQVTLRVRNLVTDAVVSARATPGPLSLADLQIDRGGGAGLEPGTTSRHPWCSPPPWPQVRELGPGELPVERTWVFQPHEIVQVHAGTHFRLAPGASLVFRGAVEMRGTARAPITFEPAVAGQPWGGIALQGDGTTGSILENVRISGGSTPAWQLVTYPGVLCLHDTREVTLRRVTVRNQAPGSDGIHTAYVEGLLLEECRFQRPTGDGMDLEFTDGTLRSCTVEHATEDGLDTMGSRLLLQDCVFLGCTDSAVSAGQRSRVELRQSLLAGSRRGALVKSASSLKLTGTLLYRNGTALRREAREVLYSGVAELESDVVFCVRNEEILDAPGKDPIDIVRISRKLPADHSLDHLLLGVLEQDTWEQAQAWIDQRLNGE
jgi:hypothetical protein